MLHARPDYQHIQDSTGRIGEDEPVFLLRAQDGLAPDVVRMWATLASHAGCDQNIIDAALEQADRMEQWQESGSVKLPDMP